VNPVTKVRNSEYFHKQKNGFKPKCKDCVNAYRREKYKNDPQARATKMKYQKQYQPLYYQINKEKFKEYAKKQNVLRKEQRRIQRQIREEQKKLMETTLLSGIEILA
jgi:hypothetical protein